jgi:hypothetical protein|uniref:Tail protein n=1 Tax=Siphoviridae sp. ct3r22 TaxID=2825325 RepID=A0A8S5V143_9CAUD|nr:MAG TPA: tail protein [Siphoviridae sp. ct3r22]
MSEEIDKLAGTTSLKISKMTLESDLMGAEKFPFVREGVKDNFITTLNRIKEYVQKDVCTVIYELKSTDLNTFKGDEAKICVIGVQKSNESATLGNHYPVQESGILIAVGTIADKTNQIYQTYNSNRLFIRCATSSGVDGEFSEWQEIAKISDVLTKNNTTPFSPTNDYNPATKKYVDSYFNIVKISQEAHQQLISNQESKNTDADEKINIVFGSADNFRNIATSLMTDNNLFFQISEKEIFKLNVSQVYVNTDNGAYELSFIYVYTSIGDANNISILTKRVFIALNNAVNLFIVRDLVTSDNLTTLTKKTKSEYDGIGIKDNSTMYAITE